MRDIREREDALSMAFVAVIVVGIVVLMLVELFRAVAS